MKNRIILFALALFTTAISYSQPTATCTVLQQPCNDDGILVTTVTGMTPPLTFTYSGSGQTIHSNVSALSDTLVGYAVYYVTVSDGNGNWAWGQTTMQSPFVVDWPVTTDAVCPSTTGSIQISVNSGALPDSVYWVDAISGLNMGSGNPGVLPPGVYNAFIFLNGCSSLSSDSGMYINNVSDITFSVQTTTAGCTNGTASVNNITGGIPPYTFQWSNGANTQTVNNLTYGYYGVTVTDAQGCYTENNWVYVSQSPYISVNTTITQATCLNNNGSVTAFASGGVPPYSYLFNNGFSGQTATGLTGGTSLNVMVTDANGCVGYRNSIYVGSSTPINVTYTTTPSSCTASTGSATLNITGGTPPYSVVWNTFPLQNGLTINNLPSASYAFTVTDAVGCVRTGSALIPPQSTINSNISTANAICPSTTGSIAVNATGNNGPFTYMWNNGSTSPALSNVSMGSYSCTITDTIGCSIIKHGTVGQISSIGLGFSTTLASCLYSNDGSINANAYGGTAPYIYQWSNGQTGNSNTGLSTGNYSVYVSDANGCHYTGTHNHTFVNYNHNNYSCYCTIQGKVFVDLNSNCLYDSGEQGVENIMVHCAGFGYAFTNSNGDYAFKVPSGTYTISEMVQYIYPLAPCQNNAVPVTVAAATGCVSTVNFANVINPLHDIKVTPINLNTPPIPGFNYTQGLIIKNNGTITEYDIQLGYLHDGQLPYVGTTPNLFTQQQPIAEPNWYSINTSFPVLSPGNTSLLRVNYTVPTNIPLNTLINIKDTAVSALPMSTWLNDYTPWDNVNDFQTVVVGSYDPNYKEVYPKGEGSSGLINTNDSVLDYVIHFQNLGTYYAQNVVIVDTLDSDLDWTSLSQGYATHDYEATIDENGVLKFTFNNINLAWQANSDYHSRGLVSYSIKQNHNLSNGTEIHNTAYIYFDFNTPVVTNTTLNTVASTVQVNESKRNSSVLIYPNPASNRLFIHADNMKEIKIYDISGRLLINERTTASSEHNVSVGNLSVGIYVVEIVKINGEKVFQRFVKN